MTTPVMTEAALLQAVRDLAAYRGFLCYHTRDSRGSEPGFPDLVLVRAGRVIFAELKSAAGRVSDDQQRWLDALTGGTVAAVVWRPVDLRSGAIGRCLS